MGATIPRDQIRGKTVSTRLTEADYVRMVHAAGHIGMAEWVREALLAYVTRRPIEEAVMAEVLAMRSVLINTLAKVAPTVDIRALNEFVDKDKREHARKALSGEER